MLARLVPHPTAARTAPDHLTVEIARSAPERLRLRYDAQGRIGDLVLPAPTAPERADQLWTTTCFEVFLQSAGSEAYCEFNFSPSTQWAAYRFDAYRAGMAPIRDLPPPEIDLSHMGECLSATVSLDLTGVADLDPAASWRVGLSAVVDAVDGGKSYWALAHPQAKPDFHHGDGFALTLPAPWPAAPEAP